MEMTLNKHNITGQDHRFYLANGYINLDHFHDTIFKIVIDDIRNFLNVRKKKKTRVGRCVGRSVIEPAVLESYKNWDNPWAILNANLRESLKILDCGSGRGVLQFYLSSKGLDVHSIDISHNRSKLFKKIHKNLIKIGINYRINPYTVHNKLNKKYNTNVKFKMESAVKLSFESGTFDRVFCISVIEHMPDPVIAKSIKEMERVLKVGGLLLLTFDYHPEVNPNIIGFTKDDFYNKVLNNCNLVTINGDPDYTINNWNEYIEDVNSFFGNKNPNTSFGVVLKKNA